VLVPVLLAETGKQPRRCPAPLARSVALQLQQSHPVSDQIYTIRLKVLRQYVKLRTSYRSLGEQALRFLACVALSSRGSMRGIMGEEKKLRPLANLLASVAFDAVAAEHHRDRLALIETVTPSFFVGSRPIETPVTSPPGATVCA